MLLLLLLLLSLSLSLSLLLLLLCSVAFAHITIAAALRCHHIEQRKRQLPNLSHISSFDELTFAA